MLTAEYGDTPSSCRTPSWCGMRCLAAGQLLYSRNKLQVLNTQAFVTGPLT